jgi:hypothetical protein
VIGWAPVRWLLGLDAIPADAPVVRWAWERPLPAWAWAAAVVGAALAAWLSYRQVDVGPGRRRTLAVIRAFSIAFLVALVAGPVLEVPRERIEPDAVLVLADRSRSLEIEDTTGADGTPRTRDAVLRSIAAQSPLDSLGAEHRVTWFGFAEALSPLPRDARGGVAVGEATGERTLLAQSIDQALARTSGRPVSAIVLLTDGRTTDPPDRALVRRLQSEGIVVSSVALGADAALGDASVADVQAPRRAFVRDLVPVEASVERRGPARTRAMRVELVDRSTGAVLDSAELAPRAGTADAARETVQLVATPPASGDASWEVRVADASAARDLIPANDRRAVPIAIVDRPVRILYVDGYPRWEYRYLKNLLQRERSVESAVMLLSADRDFAQEGNTPIARLPRTREEFDRFDLFVIGDMPASFFTGEQLAEVRRAVSERGMGLVVIGGERSTPRSWAGSALEDLLPFSGPYELDRVPDAVNLVPAPASGRMGVLRLSDDPKGDFPEELRSPDEAWSRFEWVQRIAPASLKPATEVLAQSLQSVDGSPTPLVVSMRYGAGLVTYVATDEVWRWRNGRGETYPERFWIQLLRAAARPSLGTGREEVRIAVDAGRAIVGEPVRIEVEVPPGTQASRVSLEAVASDAGMPPVEVEAVPGPGGGFVATWTPETVGRWTVRPREPTLAALAGPGAVIEVSRDDAELRDAEADRPLLETLARETGGRVVSPADLEALVASIPNRSIVTENPIRDALWNSPAALLALLGLLGSEWVLRRLSRLV